MQLAGKVALVTGNGRGLGKATALALAHAAATADELRHGDLAADLALADVSDETQIAAAIAFLASPAASYITGAVLDVNGVYYI